MQLILFPALTSVTITFCGCFTIMFWRFKCEAANIKQYHLQRFLVYADLLSLLLELLLSPPVYIPALTSQNVCCC